ncbi:MAG: ABC transporter permease [Lewinellaceae bacterium]|nr:ABC transporter permease [Lewinellaceae bacterium]
MSNLLLRNYFKIALRNMAKYRGYTLINLAGLTIGIAVCLLLVLWVNDELSYDRFHANADRMYRALWEARVGDNEWKIPNVPVPLAGTLEQEFPEVEWATQAFEGGITLKKGAEYVREKQVLFVDEDFFKVFTVETQAGNPVSALEDKNAIVLTESAARRYFGEDKQLVGRFLTRNDGQKLQIGGVVRDFPQQAHLRFDFLMSLKNISSIEQRQNEWGSASCFTYFTLKPGSDVQAVEEKLQAHTDKIFADIPLLQGENYSKFPFEKVTDIYLKPNLPYIWIFSIIGIFILLVACINFINLATARAMTRAKEVGIRKVLGSYRGQLVRQFFSEALAHVLIAVCLAAVLATLALPYFNAFAGKALSINYLNSGFIWLLLLGFVLLTTMLTGFFPAIVLSSFLPARVLKGNLSPSNSRSRLRQALVVLQFGISSALIIGTLVVRNQMHFMQQTNLGFDQSHVLVLKGARALRNNYNPFIEKIRGMAAVEQVSISQYMPGDAFDSTIFVPEQPANYTETSLTYTHVDAHFVDALKLEMAEGRNFDLSIPTDSTAFLINQTAAKRLGWDQPIGKKLAYGGQDPGLVVGVVKDFNFSSLHDAIEPVVLRMSPWTLPNIVVRLHPGDVSDQLAGIQSTWKEMAPEVPLEYGFLDQDFQKLYEKEARMAQVFLLFSILSIFIACLGLLGLAAFMTAQRAKEIGIRKVLGATTFSLVGLLSGDMLKLVMLALLIAAPAAYFLMEKWLADFAYRVHIQWWVFALTAGISIFTALFTVGFQSAKAALTNPAARLQNE